MDNPLEHLKSNYTKLGHELFHSGISKIKEYYGNLLSVKEIEDFLSTNYAYTIHKNTKKSQINPTFKPNYPRYQVQADLIEISNVAPYNKNAKFLLNCVDIFTRYCWLETLVNKKTDTVTNAFAKILEKMQTKPFLLCTDLGGEFISKHFKKFCTDHGIKLIHPRTHGKCGFVERLNQTLERMIWSAITDRGSYSFINLLPDIVHSYNNRPHRMLAGKTPSFAEENPGSAILANANKKYLSKFIKRKARYKLGTTIRIKKIRGTFDKGYDGYFNDEIYRIYEGMQ